ncbi:adenylate/guanylate cyclase domain-containing protein [Ideonella sp. A 288]|uniref:adenylate/guanylate cyclase domain-containing protein n=1 Tax=Ideonella sp. A 288 TaxID=1962181 RepID=UPI001303824B|nr:adenylate/guanylate cyclase domain-containing protein [Ideonella sp. A 288]
MSGGNRPAVMPGMCWVRRALLVADIVESVRLIREHPEDVIERWSRFMRLVSAELPHYRGVMVKSLGDGMLLGFESADDAVACGLALQPLLAPFNSDRPADRVIWLRCGVHLGEVVPTEFDWFGNSVNLAARLAALAEPGGCVASVEVRDTLTPGLDAEFVDLGDCFLKHVDQPVRCCRVRPVRTLGGTRDLAPPTLDDPTRLVMAVVPFDAADGATTAAGQQSIGDALADGLISAFSKRRDWTVQSRLSTAALRQRALHWSALSESLGATHLVCGRFRTMGRQIEVHVELHDVRRRSQLWEGEHRLFLDEYFAGDASFVPDVIAAVARAVALHEQRCAHALPLPTLDTYSLYLGGTTLMNRLSTSDFTRSRALLEQLSERAPRAASPHAVLAKWHVLCMAQGWSQDRGTQAMEARAAARRALQLDPDHAYALSVDAQTAVHTGGDLDEARLGYGRALQSDPHEPAAWYLLSGLHAYCDEGELAVAAAQRAIELSPLDPSRFLMDAYLSMAMLAAGRYDEAVAASESALQRNACLSSTYRTLALALVFSNRVVDARAAIQKLLAAEPRSTLRSYRQHYPGRHSPHMPRYVDALQMAGMPD